jgi:hypothetical protein
MAGKSTTHTDAVLNLLRATSITAPATVYVGLYSTAPANDAAAGTELTGAGGYARQAITFGAPATDTGNVRKVANTGAITFGAATGSNWAAAPSFGIFDALTSGNLLYWDTLTTPRTVLVGDTATFAIGVLMAKED